MGKAFFPLPAALDEIILFLNATPEWNMTLRRTGEFIYVYDGDQPMFCAETAEQLHAYLAACFLSTFFGDDLKAIEENIVNGTYHWRWVKVIGEA